MADNETIADIIAKKRREADYIEETARGSLKAGENYDGIAYTESDLESALDLADTKRKEADRLDAAHKRELSKNVSKNRADFGQLGNAAKLREALVQVQKKIKYLIGNLTVPNSLVASRMEINGIINDALSAPPRKCDLPEVAKDPWRAWLDDKSNWDEDGDPELEIHDWLLAPATKKEGGGR